MRGFSHNRCARARVRGRRCGDLYDCALDRAHMFTRRLSRDLLFFFSGDEDVGQLGTWQSIGSLWVDILTGEQRRLNPDDL